MAVALRRDGFRFLKHFGGCCAAWVGPSAWDFQVAIGALAVFQAVLPEVMPRAADQKHFARRAGRVRCVAVNVSLIHIMQTGL